MKEDSAWKFATKGDQILKNMDPQSNFCSTDDENAIGTAPGDACSSIGSAAAVGNYDASTAPFTADGNDSISIDVSSYLNDEVEILEHKPHYSAILTPKSIPPSSAWIVFFSMNKLPGSGKKLSLSFQLN